MKAKLVHALLFAVLFVGSSASLLADGGPGRALLDVRWTCSPPFADNRVQI